MTGFLMMKASFVRPMARMTEQQAMQIARESMPG